MAGSSFGVSDVSKMMARHNRAFRPSSTVSTRTVPAGSTSGARPSHTTSYLLMKCQEILRKENRQLYIQELQMLLGAEHKIAKDKEFLKLLAENPRIQYDEKKKKWSFLSPYEDIKDSSSIMVALKSKPEYKNGMDVSAELLSHHPDAEKWIIDALRGHKIRAVRATRNVRCKNYATDSGIQCDLYEEDRCDACAPLRGIILYALEGDHLENCKVDDDLREMWLEYPLPVMEKIMEECALNRKRPNLETKDSGRRRKKRPANGVRVGRVAHIANTHIYSAEEFRTELEASVEAGTI